MKVIRRVLPLVGAALLGGALIVPAFASGPGGGQGNGNGSTGRQIVQLWCSNNQSYTVSVPAANNSMGAGQIVDQQGHLIPVATEFIAYDTTINQVIDDESSGGNGHQVQPTIHCVAEFGPFTDPETGDQIVGFVFVTAVLQA